MGLDKTLESPWDCKDLREYSLLPSPAKPYLTGHDLIRLGVKPGPEFGRILREAEDLRLEGELTSRKKALVWLRARVGHMNQIWG